MSFLSFLGFGKSKIKDALREGAVIIDVRTGQEFDNGHIPEALNIPVDRIDINIPRIKAMKRPIIVCCNSGHRSTIAMGKLKDNGIKDVHNVGDWHQLARILKNL